MELKEFVDFFQPMTCILSVEKKAEGKYGAIRIVTGNEVYIESIGLARGNKKVEGIDSAEFIPNSEYQRYIPQDQNFEEACYRCAVLKQPLHEYVNPERYAFGIDTFMLPIDSDDEDLGYCTYTQVFVPKEDNSLLASKISPESAVDVLNTCIKLRGASDFNTVMQEIISDIRISCDAELSCVLLIDETKRSCSVLCESKREGSPYADVKDLVSDDFYALVETWQDTLGGSYCLFLKDEHEMRYLKKRNPAWYASLAENGVNSLLLFPLRSRGHFHGYLWAVNFSSENAVEIKPKLEVLCYFIASEIASFCFVERLQAMSRTDELTGVLNRNEMNKRITEIGKMQPGTIRGLGIIFADMNGLKYVNDHEGHDAGDELLVNSAMILKSSFPGDEVFRAGGDEFMILLQNTTAEEMQAKIDEIKAKSEMFENVSFAAGCCCCEEVQEIHQILKNADVRMYEDKRKFYLEHPERSRD